MLQSLTIGHIKRILVQYVNSSTGGDTSVCIPESHVIATVFFMFLWVDVLIDNFPHAKAYLAKYRRRF